MMGWLDRLREARAEAAVRRRLVAFGGGPQPRMPDPMRPNEPAPNPYAFVHGLGHWATGRDEPGQVLGRRCVFVEGGGQTVAGRVIAWTDQPCYDVELLDGSRRMVLARFLSWVEDAAPPAGGE